MLVAATAFGCKRKKAPPPAKVVDAGAGAANCPTPDDLAKLLAEPERTVRTGCVGFTTGTSWMAAALGYDTASKAQPRLRLVSGGYGGKPFAFDIEPSPTDELTKLIAASSDVNVTIKMARSDPRLVRVGVAGTKSDQGPMAREEIAILLELGAHAPPKWLWAGPGNQASRGEDGCVRERLVEFERPFGRRIDMIVSSRAQPSGKGAAPQDCSSGPGFQDTLSVNPTPLKPGRQL
jgi:hypothetical protein